MHNESSLSQEFPQKIPRTRVTRRRCGRSVLLGPGSDFAEEPAFRVWSRPRWLLSRSLVSSRAHYLAVAASTSSCRYTASLIRRLSDRKASFFVLPSASLRSK